MRRLLLFAALPCALPAQSTGSISPFVAIDQSLSTRPLLIGLQTAINYGPLGVRFSASAAHSSWQRADTASPVEHQPWRAFAGDFDVVLNPGRQAGAAGTFGALEPRLFAGYGMRAEVMPDSETVTHNVVSIGSVLSYSILSKLRLDVEARRLAPANAVQDLFESARGGWEYRAGLSFQFGTGVYRPSGGVIPGLPGTGGSGGGRIVSPAPGTLLATADRQLGTPYVWGGTTPGKGFDCSGFVQYVYSNHGVRLPRTSREMALLGKSVGTSIEALQPGDLMFFAQNGGGISHVAIYAGNNMMVHSSSTGKGVGYDDLTTPRGNWYRKIFVGSQRVLGVPIEGVTVASKSVKSVPKPTNAWAFTRDAQTNVGAFLRAAGMPELSDVAKRLYRPDEKPDAPDNAPPRRW